MELRRHERIECIICLTGQHQEMLQQIMECFKIQANYNLQVMNDNQNLTDLTTILIKRIGKVLDLDRPDIVLVHGDTTTSFTAALASFYRKIPVGHVEAGLRTGNLYSPFPEEANRSLIARLAYCHFAPTELNKHNLEKENIWERIYVTGNTGIDAFHVTVQKNYQFFNKALQQLDFSKKILLVTAHRRENLGRPLEQICRALLKIISLEKDIYIVYPVHLNPKVREIVFPILEGNKQIILTDPLNVLDMHNLMARSFFVMTDSGGLQEEAPAMGKPVLVLRRETERPEAIEAGTARLAGTDENTIVTMAEELLTSTSIYKSMARAVNPYGDGHASQKIVSSLLELMDRRIQSWNLN